MATSQPIIGISAEKLRALLQQDAKTALARCLDKKTGKLKKNLPPSLRRQAEKELAALTGEEEGNQEELAVNKRDLAKKLGISPPTLYQRLFAYPDHPRPTANNKWRVNEWKEFAKKKGVAQYGSADKEPEQLLSPEQRVKLRRFTARARKDEIGVDMLLGEYRRVDEVNAAIDTANAIVTRELRKAFEHELPPMLEGCSAAEIQEELRRKLNEVFEHLPKQLEKIPVTTMHRLGRPPSAR